MHTKFIRLFTVLLTFLVTSLSFSSSAEGDLAWPLEIFVDAGVIVIYQPQPDALDGVSLTARAAVGLEMKGLNEPLFLSILFKTTLDTDHQNRTAILRDIVITDVVFPTDTADKSKEKRFRSIVETELTKRELKINLDNLIATLDATNEPKNETASLNTQAPLIRFVNEPAVLISIDGPPQIREVEGIQRVVNTPYTIVQDPLDKYWYLNADANRWYKTKELSGEWLLDDNTPPYVQNFAPKSEINNEAGVTNASEAVSTENPRIILATEPTELISSVGEPMLTPIAGTKLLYVSNTDSDVFMDTPSSTYYILLSGRWYQSKSTEGPWKYTHGNDLPADFFNIPANSDFANVRYAIPGTEEAQDAVREAELPQTATVDRKTASLMVEYDGEPQFEAIANTSLTYATNTATPVIYAEQQYYAVDEAVWFVANTPKGTWQVASEIPDEIYQIPPESPLYYVTFVEIYSSTPDDVHLGYTQGYTNAYVDDGTVVYGTGYNHRGWVGRNYYPRASTWGFHARYTPRRGWNQGLSYSSSRFAFNIGRGSWYRGSWWGPSRYRGYRQGYKHGNRAGFRAGYRVGKHSDNNLYRSKRNVARTKVSPRRAVNINTPRVANNRKNNVYVDRNGNVHRNNKGQWEKRTNKGWANNQLNQPAKVATPRAQNNGVNNNLKNTHRPVKNTPKRVNKAKPRTNQANLNRSYKSRQRGNIKSRQASPSRGGGGRGR